MFSFRIRIIADAQHIAAIIPHKTPKIVSFKLKSDLENINSLEFEEIFEYINEPKINDGLQSKTTPLRNFKPYLIRKKLFNLSFCYL